MKRTALLVSVALFLSVGVSAANAGIVYTITDGGGGPGTFSIVGASALDSDPIFTPSGADNFDGDDALVAFVNNSSSVISKIHIEGNGSDAFGFDGTGPWGGSYEPPSGLVTLTTITNDSGDVNFLAPTFLAPGATTFVGLEDDGAGVLSSAVLTVTESTVTPEPSTFALFGTMLTFGGGWFVMRRRRAAAASNARA